MCDICKAMDENGMTPEEAVNHYYEALTDTIKLHGWALTGLDDGNPPYTYTVGRTLQGLPELMINGLDLPRRAAILTSVQEQGLEVTPGARLENVLTPPWTLGVVEADPRTAELIVAIRMFGLEREVTALQLVWPDPKNRMPWDQGYHSEVPQPLYPVLHQNLEN